jgi:hypothetical protein
MTLNEVENSMSKYSFGINRFNRPVWIWHYFGVFIIGKDMSNHVAACLLYKKIKESVK